MGFFSRKIPFFLCQSFTQKHQININNNKSNTIIQTKSNNNNESTKRGTKNKLPGRRWTTEKKLELGRRTWTTKKKRRRKKLIASFDTTVGKGEEPLGIPLFLSSHSFFLFFFSFLHSSFPPFSSSFSLLLDLFQLVGEPLGTGETLRLIIIHKINTTSHTSIYTPHSFRA